VAPTLSEVIVALERLAPLRFAEAWDNVGLIIEPDLTGPALSCSRVLFTIDLTDAVASEAEHWGASLIVAYHPPIFGGLKRLRASVPAERVVVRCLRAGISVYSPHTALDAAPDGVNQWLLAAFGAGERAPCLPSALDGRYGQGRYVELLEPLSLEAAVAAVKAHLGLSHVRLSAAAAHSDVERPIRRIAVCAGAGGSVFEKLSGYDLLITGELRHHDLRERAASGTSVILCEHTNTERGFLPIFAERLGRSLGSEVSLRVATCDRDPLSVV
jgi:dinuclear metal center YbgI/SA1388 family protein